MTDREESITVWQPLREPVFRAMWTAALVSNVGTWMQNVGAAWLMTSLTTSALLVALVQTATTLPVVLVSLPAGAIGDIVDRRWLLIVVQAWMLVTAVILKRTDRGRRDDAVGAVVAHVLARGRHRVPEPDVAGDSTGVGLAKELPAAISLGAVGFNIARAVGPAVGGLILAATGTATVFFLNAVSFVAVLIVVYRWEREPSVSELPPERLSESIYRGVRFVRNDPDLRSVLTRTVIFIAFASAIWALLPLLVRNQLGLGAGGYGIVLGVTGLGSAAGITVLERARKRFTTNQVVIGASALFGLTLVVLGLVHVVAVALVAVALGGLAWISVSVEPEHRGADALPGVGSCTDAVGVHALFPRRDGRQQSRVGRRRRPSRHADDVRRRRYRVASRPRRGGSVAVPRTPTTSICDPPRTGPTPVPEFEPTPDAGPVLVSVEYRIDPTTAADFLDAMRELEGVRRRNGARYWNVFRDTETPDRYFEVYVTGTWMAHLREHERVSVADREIQKRATSFHVGDEPPEVTHFVSEMDG